MAVGVIAHFVSGGGDALRCLRVAFYVFTNHEEGCFHVFFSQHRQHGIAGALTWRVIESQSDAFAFVCAVADEVAEELVTAGVHQQV